MRKKAKRKPESKAQKLAKLQKQWYAKLAKEGFKDIEWVDHKTGRGHDSRFLRGSLQSGKQYHAGRELYFQLATNYVNHCHKLRRRKYDYFIWKLHSEGHTYDYILEQTQSKFRNAPSKYTLFYQLKEIAQQCFEWNQTHDEGLIKKRAEDKEKFENSVLAEFETTEYNWMLSGQGEHRAKKTSRK